MFRVPDSGRAHPCLPLQEGKPRRLWDIKHSKPTPQTPVPTPLPSDAYQRKDLQYLKQVRVGSHVHNVRQPAPLQLRSCACITISACEGV